MSKVTTRTASGVIERREAFTTSGALRGTWDRGSLGVLPDPWREAYESLAWRTGRDDLYTVYSYRTPIAWWTRAEGWTIPDVKYSPTTSKHQGNLRNVRQGAKIAL